MLENNHLTLQSASVDDIDVSQSICEAIEKHAKTKQEVETAKQNKLRQEVENERKIEQEKAKAETCKEHGWYKYNNKNPVIMEKEE